MTPAFPKRGPDAGTMDQVRPHCAAWHQTTLTVDWPTYPLQTPSGGGLAPTPDRSKTPAKGFLASGEEGLTNQGPLQKALIDWLGSLGVSLMRIGLEAGPLSQWVYAAVRQAGLTVEPLETRHVRNAFKIMPVKTDRKDARGIAELMRLGWFRPVHCKSMEAQETRAILTSRKLVQKMLHETEMSLRGVLRNFGLKVGQVAAGQFEFRIRELVEGHPTLTAIAASLLATRATLRL